jgi:LEA14-like dessication related protein
VQIPTPVDLAFDGIAYELELNGKSFAKGVGNQSITVPRYGHELMDVDGTSTLLDILH